MKVQNLVTVEKFWCFIVANYFIWNDHFIVIIELIICFIDMNLSVLLNSVNSLE